MTGTETFTVLSSEELEQVSGGRMIRAVDNRH
ncbi:MULTISPECIES: bacteriocin [Streptococcus]|nr:MULTISPECIES: bacteriocin [Streptococcus]